ncbi:MAG: hypothetical protein KGL43_19980, partial [Burkholderiales bacterium]|nr:hypothetical protein [Burkholderiales bacterium]
MKNLVEKTRERVRRAEAVSEAATAAPDMLAEWVPAVRDWAPTFDLKTLVVHVKWLVEGLIQARKVGALVAAGGTGKT